MVNGYVITVLIRAMYASVLRIQWSWWYDHFHLKLSIHPLYWSKHFNNYIIAPNHIMHIPISLSLPSHSLFHASIYYMICSSYLFSFDTSNDYTIIMTFINHITTNQSITTITMHKQFYGILNIKSPSNDSLHFTAHHIILSCQGLLFNSLLIAITT